MTVWAWGTRPEGDGGTSAEFEGDRESELVWHLWQHQREHGPGVPADRWSTRRAWCLFWWRVVR